MPITGAPVQLGTRISRELHKKLRLHCVERGITNEQFVTEAIEEKLERDGGKGDRHDTARGGERSDRKKRHPGGRSAE